MHSVKILRLVDTANGIFKRLSGRDSRTLTMILYIACFTPYKTSRKHQARPD
jgi:hypothetical protein